MVAGDSMFVFEVVVEKITSHVLAKEMHVKAEFADVFDLDIKDPKYMNITLPEPPPPPPEPPGKKGKKGKGGKKGKKGKKGAAPPPPPPEPVIQSGQSVLFPSSLDILRSTMMQHPLLLSLWSIETSENIGSTSVTWSPDFWRWFDQMTNCNEPDPPPAVVKGEYNIFDETSAKLMATVTMQIKLTNLKEKIFCQFRTIANPDIRASKCLYTVPFVTKTSFLCKMPNPSKEAIQNSQEINEYKFVKDTGPIVEKTCFADYRNAMPTNTLILNDPDFCCRGRRDAPPKSIYQAPKTLPTFDYMADYVDNLIRDLNVNLRSIIPVPTIRPIIRASDLSKRCFCRPEDLDWPKSDLADVMRYYKKYQRSCIPCKYAEVDDTPRTIEISQIRGPCGRYDCKVAKAIRAFVQKQADEDNTTINIDEIIGPCGNPKCKLAKTIQDFIRREGVFQEGETVDGLSTACGCQRKLRKALEKEETTDESSENPSPSDCCCSVKTCPTKLNGNNERVYTVAYFFVHYDHEDQNTDGCPCTPEPDDCENCTGGQDVNDPADGTQQGDYRTCSDVCGYEYPRVDAPDAYYDGSVEIDLNEITNPCNKTDCDVANKVKNIIVDGYLNAKPPDPYSDPCYCDCKCTFNFGRKTTFCPLCGGYEEAGDDIKHLAAYEFPPLPCPIYHNLFDKSKFLVNMSNFDESAENKKSLVSRDTGKTSSRMSEVSSRESQAVVSKDDKGKKDTSLSDEPSKTKSPSTKLTKEEEEKIEKTKKKIGKFTMNYAYKSPSSSHSSCTNNNREGPMVPKNMGWLWNAKNVPGLKYRPDWRPGATSKKVVQMLRSIKHPECVKRKKKTLTRAKSKAKSVEKTPLLVIMKKDREYKVVLQTMKSIPRQPNEYPYEGDPQTYCVGRTEKSNQRRLKKIEREARRRRRDEKRYVQQSFKNMCSEICGKALNQALGVVEEPKNKCECFQENLSDDENTCSCSDGTTSSADTETDNDEWIVEFTPPIATYDVNFIRPPEKCDSEAQYNFEDFRVKLLDRYGKPVPRFFKGPDGKLVCSDLGGFYGPDGTWLEIGVDGYVGPDNRWVPSQFMGPDGEMIDSEEGRFQDASGRWLVIGIDGYVNVQGKWVFYPEKQVIPLPAKKVREESEWSCLGTADPELIAELGIVGHGRDRRLIIERLTKAIEAGANLTIPVPVYVPRMPRSGKFRPKLRSISSGKFVCKHSKPSPKGVIGVDAYGNKIYFSTKKDSHCKVSGEYRKQSLVDQGIKICDYHDPCFTSMECVRSNPALK